MVSTGNRRRIALQGNLRQKRKNGQFYYRLQVSKGVRKEFALKTSDPDEAVNKAFDLDSLWLAPTAEVAFAQMKAIRGFSKLARLPAMLRRLRINSSVFPSTHKKGVLKNQDTLCLFAPLKHLFEKIWDNCGKNDILFH
jgi:hypothetical protein